MKAVSDDLRSRSSIPGHVYKVLDALPTDTHPMTQFSQAVMALQTGSMFAKAYHEGIHKSKYWSVYYEDAMDLIAKLPQVCGACEVWEFGRILLLLFGHSLYPSIQSPVCQAELVSLVVKNGTDLHLI